MNRAEPSSSEASGHVFSISPLEEGVLYRALAGGVLGVDPEWAICSCGEPLSIDGLRSAWTAIMVEDAGSDDSREVFVF